MRSRLTWLLVAAPAVLGAEIAHAAAETLVGRAGSPTELFASVHAPGLVAGLVFLGAAALVGVAARTVHACSGVTLPRPTWRRMVVLALLIYVVQEHVELALAGRPWWEASFSTAFAVGIAVQLPLAAAAYLLARTLSRAADGIGRLVSRPPRRRPAADLFRRRALRPEAPIPRPLRSAVRPSRGPPLLPAH